MDRAVQQLIQISEQDEIPPTTHPKSPEFRLNPLPKTRSLPHFQPKKVHIRTERPTPTLLQCPDLSPFHSYLHNLPVKFQCKCVFRGCGGFRGRNRGNPCSSVMCVNRVMRKYQWKDKGSEREVGGTRGEKKLERGLTVQSFGYFPVLTPRQTSPSGGQTERR